MVMDGPWDFQIDLRVSADNEDVRNDPQKDPNSQAVYARKMEYVLQKRILKLY